MIEYGELLELERKVRDSLELHDRISEPCSSYEELRKALAKVEAARAPLIRQNEHALQSYRNQQLALARGGR